MMLIDAGRGQEALELDQELLGYLKEDKNQSRNILDENHADAAVSATKCVISHKYICSLVLLLVRGKFLVSDLYC